MVFNAINTGITRCKKYVNKILIKILLIIDKKHADKRKMICCRIVLTNVDIVLKYSCRQDIDGAFKKFIADILPDEWPGSLYDSAVTVTIGG